MFDKSASLNFYRVWVDGVAKAINQGTLDIDTAIQQVLTSERN